MTIQDRCLLAKKELRSLLLLGAILVFGLVLSGKTSAYITEGLLLSVEHVIPTALPFMIISDLYVSYGKPENIRILKRAFTKLFGMSAYGIGPFVCGNVCGFPIGAKMTSNYYSAGLLSKDDAERLIAISNNPSCAFVVGGVGLGIYSDLKIGISLLCAIYISTIIVGVITRGKFAENAFPTINIEQKYNFVSSVKSAGMSSISIIAFISLFCGINGLVVEYIKYEPAILIFSAFSEVTNAIKVFDSNSTLSYFSALVFSAFSLGFGGICVGLQSEIFTSSVGLSMKKYYRIKLFNALLSAIVFSLIFSIVK